MKIQDAITSRGLALSAVMTALVMVTTLLIQIPIPATDGFFNVGDGIIMVAALTFGPVIGAVAGGLGAALADLAGGWYVWVLPTFMIKGLEGLLAGRIRQCSDSFALMVVAWLVGGLEMVTGYFLVQVYLYGLSAALVELPFNFVQMTISGVVGIPITQVVQRLHIL
jgi:uncharacterized membrane protein